jgi:hypothetical protein
VIIALASAAVLLYEVAITRLLSVVLWYHFAFLSVSLAMLGVGAPGVWMALRPVSTRALRIALGAASIALPASVFVITQVAAPFAIGGSDAARNLKVALIVISVAAPLLCLGFAVCFLLVNARSSGIARMYGADLVGGALGAVATVPLLGLIDTPSLLALVGLLPLIALALSLEKGRIWVLASAVALILSVGSELPYKLSHNKSYDESSFVVIHEEWTPTARLTVLERNPYTREGSAWGWGFGSKYQGADIQERWLEQDGSAGTPVTAFNGDLEKLSFLDYDVTGIGYALREPKRACVIGAGGGRDVLTALRAGVTNVDAVELHPETISIVTNVLGSFSGDPYHLPGVQAHSAEGRSFLSGSSELYDLVQISLIDSWAATAAGAYSLSENYLYTVEAFRLYLSRLNTRGVLSVTRWLYGPDHLEVGRLVLLAEEVMRLEGLDRERHMVVIQGGPVATLLLSASPFTAAELKTFDDIAAKRGFLRHWPMTTPPAKNSLVLHVLMDGPQNLAQYGFDLSPPTDDRPFFFQRMRPFTSIAPELRASLSTHDEAPLLARSLTIIVGLLTLFLFFAPFFRLRGRRAQSMLRGSVYFVAIGIGFMLVEAPLIQRLILVLGHPSYATTVVLSTLLLASGIGAVVSGSQEASEWRRWRLLVVGVALLAALLGPLALGSLIGTPLFVRIAASVVLLAPLGFVLGFPFPVGLRLFGDEDISWYWALNGAAGVLATVSSVALAAYIGFSGTIALGIAAYIIAAIVIPPAKVTS